jgi:hypothetical protein
MLAAYNTHYPFLTQQVADFEQRLATRMALYRQQEQLLVTIPGVE